MCFKIFPLGKGNLLKSTAFSNMDEILILFSEIMILVQTQQN